jgi:predicted nuclease of predicted toxin-antitoxin system
LRLLADENVPGDTIHALREAGHDVVWVATEPPSVNDGEVLARATRDRRVLLTFDEGVSEFVVRAGLPAESGVVLFRGDRAPLAERTQLAVSVLLQRMEDWTGWFSVVRGDHIRRIPLRSARCHGA